MSQTRTERLPSAPSSLARAEKPKASPGYLTIAWRRLRRDIVSMVALVILVLICLTALAAPLISSRVIGQDPNRGRLTQRFKPPSAQNRLGTDDFGRDTLARLIHAGRVSLSIGFMVAAIALTVGVALGLIGGYFGGKTDDVINAIIQLFINIPLLFLLILLAVLFKPTVIGLALIFGLTGWPNVARLVRGRVLAERRRDYVDAAIVAGARPGRVMYQHILPNVSSIVLVVAGFEIGGAILAEAGLSALGFGVQVPTASWGNMLSKSLEYSNSAPWLVIAPGVAIVLTVFAIFLFSDGLRDALDPRLKR